MQSYLKYAKDKKLEDRVLTESYNDDFAKEINQFLQLMIQTHGNHYVYTKKNKEQFHYPYLGVIGKFALENNHFEGLPTSVRFIALRRAMKEYVEGWEVVVELLDRLSDARKVIPTLPEEKKEMAQKKFETMSYVMNLIFCGVSLVESMVKYLNYEESMEDSYDSDISFDWRNYLASKNFKPQLPQVHQQGHEVTVKEKQQQWGF